MDLGNVQLQDSNKTNRPILYEAIKGRIWEQSDESSSGCNFCICLPVFPVHRESNSPLTQFLTVSLSDTVLLNFISTIAQSLFFILHPFLFHCFIIWLPPALPLSNSFSRSRHLS